MKVWPGCSVTGAEAGKSTLAFEGSRAPTRKYCAVMAEPPVLVTVKVAVSDWFTAGDAGENARAVVTMNCPGVFACTVKLVGLARLCQLVPSNHDGHVLYAPAVVKVREAEYV